MTWDAAIIEIQIRLGKVKSTIDITRNLVLEYLPEEYRRVCYETWACHDTLLYTEDRAYVRFLDIFTTGSPGPAAPPTDPFDDEVGESKLIALYAQPEVSITADVFRECVRVKDLSQYTTLGSRIPGEIYEARANGSVHIPQLLLANTEGRLGSVFVGPLYTPGSSDSKHMKFNHQISEEAAQCLVARVVAQIAEDYDLESPEMPSSYRTKADKLTEELKGIVAELTKNPEMINFA